MPSDPDLGEEDHKYINNLIGCWKLDKEVENKLHTIFDALDSNKDLILNKEEQTEGEEKLEEFLSDIGVTWDGVVKQRDNSNMTFHDLKTAVEREREVLRKEESLAAINLKRIVASCIPGGCLDNPLLALEVMEKQQIQELCKELAGKLEEAFVDYRNDRMRICTNTSAHAERSDGNEKYAVARFGTMEEFHYGLTDMLGFPNTDLKKAMYDEHCKTDDAEVGFRVGNYTQIVTTPRA
jgi:hypothetical protein